MTHEDPQEPMIRSAVNRPCYPSLAEHDGPYNVRAEEVPGGAEYVWNTCDRPPALSEAEFAEVVSVVSRTISKHGVLPPPLELPGIDFFIEEGYFDRTVKVDIVNYVRFWEVVVPLTCDLCECLKDRPLWRVMFGVGESESPEDVIVVYPGAVRVDSEEKADSITGRLIQIAEARLHAWSQRENHRRQRRMHLAHAIPMAFERLQTSADPAVVVGVFDTLSFPMADLFNEGRTGRSIVLLFRDERDYHHVGYTTDPPDELGYPYFATESGILIDALPSDAVPTTSKMLMDFQPPGATITLCWGESKWTFGATQSGKLPALEPHAE